MLDPNQPKGLGYIPSPCWHGDQQWALFLPPSFSFSSITPPPRLYCYFFLPNSSRQACTGSNHLSLNIWLLNHYKEEGSRHCLSSLEPPWWPWRRRGLREELFAHYHHFCRQTIDNVVDWIGSGESGTSWCATRTRRISPSRSSTITGTLTLEWSRPPSWTTCGSCQCTSELLRKLQGMLRLWFWLLSCSYLEHQ